MLRVLKENITQQTSFDPLLRHLHRKNNLFHKSDSSKKLHALVTLLFVMDLYSGVWILEYFVKGNHFITT